MKFQLDQYNKILINKKEINKNKEVLSFRMSLEEKVGFLDKVIKKGKRLCSWALISSMLLTGVFACDKKDSPTSPGNPFQTEIGISNENGIVNFENGIITVLDGETQEPMEDITVSNFNGEDYNVVTPHDADYFPFSGLFSNITDETLFIHEKVEIGYERYVKKELNSTEKNICSKFLNHLDNLSSRSGAYKKTISGNEAIYSYYVIEGILYFTGWDFIMQVVGNVNRFFNEEGDDLQTYIYENNWDRYEFDHPAGFDGKIYYTVPSNQPELNLEAIVGNNNEVEIQFFTFDKFYYEDLDFQDATITDRGPTSDNDLLILYEVFQNGGSIYSNSLSFSSNSESNTRNISLTLPNGSYEIEAKLFDDTFYKDIFHDSGINQSQINTNFQIGASLFDIITEYDAPSNNTTGLVWVNNCLYTCDPTEDKIYKLDSQMNILNQYDAPYSDISGLLWDGQNIWCSNGTVKKIAKLDQNMDILLEYLYWGGLPVGDMKDLGSLYKTSVYYKVISSNYPSISFLGSNNVGTYCPTPELISPKGICSKQNDNLYVVDCGQIVKFGGDLPNIINIIDTYPFPVYGAEGLDYYNEYFWSCKDNKIYKHNPD